MPLYGNVAKVVITKYTYSEKENGEYVKSTSGEKCTYMFNEDGNVTSSISPTYSKKIKYDKNGRKISKNWRIGTYSPKGTRCLFL